MSAQDNKSQTSNLTAAECIEVFNKEYSIQSDSNKRISEFVAAHKNEIMAMPYEELSALHKNIVKTMKEYEKTFSYINFLLKAIDSVLYMHEIENKLETPQQSIGSLLDILAGKNKPPAVN